MGCLEGSGVPVLYIGRTVPSDGGVMLTTDIHLAPSLRMSGSVPLIPPVYLNGVYKISIFFVFYGLKGCRLWPKLWCCLIQYWRRMVVSLLPHFYQTAMWAIRLFVPPLASSTLLQYSVEQQYPGICLETLRKTSKNMWMCVNQHQHFTTSRYVWCCGRDLRGRSDPTWTRTFL